MKSCAPTNLAAATIRSNCAVDRAERDVLGDRAGEQLHLLRAPRRSAGAARRATTGADRGRRAGRARARADRGRTAAWSRCSCRSPAARPRPAPGPARSRDRCPRAPARRRRCSGRPRPRSGMWPRTCSAGPGAAARSVGSFSSSSRRANAARTVCSCCQAPTTWRIGASARAARMVAAIRAPIDSSPAMIARAPT